MTTRTFPTDARAWVEVDLGALVRNARALAAHAQKPLIPMIKADAYGVGAVAAARALEAVDPLAYGVSSVDEAIELRQAGIERPIILFTPSMLESPDPEWIPSDALLMARYHVTPTLARREHILAWGRSGDRPAWHLAIDTGMHRAGIDHRSLALLHEAIAEFPPLGAFTHFHSAELDDGSMETQEKHFRVAVSQLPRRPRLLHAENSAAIVRRPASEWDCVRPGVFLYGVSSGQKAALRPEPVVSLRARVVEVRTVPAGDSVSYGATWRAERQSEIATVCCGYADGLRRHLGGTHGCGLVRGQRAPIAGLITMDMTMLDVTGTGCTVGDVVTFIGRDGDEALTAEGIAGRSGLSPYELLVGLRLRLPRVYTGTW